MFVYSRSPWFIITSFCGVRISVESLKNMLPVLSNKDVVPFLSAYFRWETG